ncbi:MAG: hypothetical protein Q8O82_18740 [Pseudorhodobacter sp.]|nr:hypothetical protein [Pseudorhodobacter sp.]
MKGLGAIHGVGFALAALVVPLAACGPVSLETAEAQCFERARLAAAPRGTVAIGAGTGGAAANFDISISSGFLTGQDPAAIYDACVTQKSGQPPRQPLYSRTDWKG